LNNSRLARSFRGFLPKLRGNLIGMAPKEIAPGKDVRLYQ